MIINVAVYAFAFVINVRFNVNASMSRCPGLLFSQLPTNAGIAITRIRNIGSLKRIKVKLPK